MTPADSQHSEKTPLHRYTCTIQYGHAGRNSNNRQASKERPSISRKAQRENKKMEMKLEAAIQAGFCWERKPKNFMFTLNGEFLRRLWWCNKVTAFSCAEHVFMDRSRIRRKSASATGKRYMSVGV